MYKTDYATVAASQTADTLGAGKKGDIVERLIVVPATTAPGQVLIKDGNGSDITVFTGGTGSVADLSPITVELGARSANGTSPGWHVTTGANVSVIAIGRFG